MTKCVVEIHPDELKKKNCLTCKYGEMSTGTPCFEKHNEIFEECDENFSKFEPIKKEEKIPCKYKFFDKEKFDGKTYCTLFNEVCEDISFVCDKNCQVYEDLKELEATKNKLQVIEDKQREAASSKKILDACCGSRMFYFDKNRADVVFMDNRETEEVLCDGRKLSVKPDIVADFKEMPFEDNSFNLVIFDPPHLLKVGEKSWLCKKYGRLSESWPSDIKKGFDECLRVLKPEGTLIFKWATRDISLKDILNVIEKKPLIFHKNNNTFFLVFTKGGV